MVPRLVSIDQAVLEIIGRINDELFDERNQNIAWWNCGKPSLIVKLLDCQVVRYLVFAGEQRHLYTKHPIIN
jgi:hypothetical protein